MAIAFDVGANSGVKAAISSYTFNTPNIAVLTNGLAVVTTQARGATADGDLAITGITLNSVAMTKAIARLETDTPATGSLRCEIWYLVAPTSGVTTVSVTFTGTVTTATAYCGSFSGVDQSSPLDTTAGASANAQASPDTVSITTGIDNALLVDSIYNKIGTALTKGANQNLIAAELLPNAGTDTSDSSYKILATAAGSNSMSWTFVGTDSFDQVVASFKPFVAASTTFLSRLMLLGVG